MPEIYTSEIQFKRGTEDQLDTYYRSGENIPAEGEPIYNIDSKSLTIGDGQSNYFNLCSVYENGLINEGLVYTPYMFGAKADAISGSNPSNIGTDDTEAFLKCFYQIDDNGNLKLDSTGSYIKRDSDLRDVYVPKGKYRIDGTIVIPAFARMILHPSAVLISAKNNCIVHLSGTKSELIGGYFQNYFDNEDSKGNKIYNDDELNPVIRIGVRDRFDDTQVYPGEIAEFDVESRPNHLNYAKIINSHVYRINHVGPCIHIESGAKYKYLDNGELKTYYRETYFCTLDNIIVNGGSVGVRVTPCITLEEQNQYGVNKMAGWNNGHRISGMCIINDKAIWLQGNGNVVNVTGQTGTCDISKGINLDRECILVESEDNCITAHIYDIGLNDDKNDCLINVKKGEGNTLISYLTNNGYYKKNFIKGNIENLTQNYTADITKSSKKYDGNDILVYAGKRNLLTSNYQFKNCYSNTNIGYDINAMFDPSSSTECYIYKYDPNETSTNKLNYINSAISNGKLILDNSNEYSFEFELNLKTASLGGYAISFGDANYFDTCELWSKKSTGQYEQINKLNLDQNTTYKLRVEDMNKMGTTESIKFIFKGNENIWRNRSNGQIAANIRLRRFIAWDSQNIGYVPTANNMMLVSPNGTPYKITVSDSGVLTATAINNSN